MAEEQFHMIEEAIEDFRNGKIVIVVDDEDRENEGDFVLAAEKVTPEAINFFVTEGRGVVCSPLTAERAKELNLDPMVEANTSLHETPFTVSIDYLHGTTTGVSVSDRAITVRAWLIQTLKRRILQDPGIFFRCEQWMVVSCAGQDIRKRWWIFANSLD